MSEQANNVRVAIIGAGHWGKNLVRVNHSLGALAAVCDTDHRVIEKCRADYPGVTTVDNPEEVFADGSVDAVFVATPAETHFEYVRQGLNAGKHVFVEKPLCLDVGEGAELVALAKGKKLILMVGHLLQYHPAVTALKKLIDDGELGRLQYIYSNRLNLGKIRTEENILWSFAPHDISVMLSLAREMPDRVSAFGSHFLHDKIADVTLSHFLFPSGVTAHIFVSWLHPFKEQKLVVVGDRKMAVFNDTEPEHKLLLYPHEINWRGGVPVPAKKEAEVIAIDTKEPLLIECETFLRAVKTGDQPPTGGEEGLNVLSVLTACQSSIEHGGRVIEPKRRTAAVAVPYQVHETAVIDDGCQIGEGTKIWHFSHLMRGCVVGPRCNIGQNVVIGPNVCTSTQLWPPLLEMYVLK